jgi:hypothetical protein
MAGGVITAAVIGAGSSILGNIFGNAAKEEESEALEKAAEAQYKYNKAAWKDNKNKLNADFDWLYTKILDDEFNETNRTKYLDQLNLDTYNDKLAIRDYQEKSLQDQYEKSEALYAKGLSLSVTERDLAVESTYRKRKEIQQAARFSAQKLIVDAVEAQGKLRARGAAGRSIEKAAAAAGLPFMNQQTALVQSLVSADQQTVADLKNTQLDYEQYLRTLDANRMLQPRELPMPTKPRPLPIMKFTYPRELEDFDYGPEPIKQATPSFNSTLSFASNAINTAGSLVTDLAKAGVFSG